MINLKEQEALNYLQRAKETIDQTELLYKDKTLPKSCQLLSYMLDLEGVYLQYLQSKGLNELAHISVDATGFPSLDPWLIDAEKLMDEFSQVRNIRARVLAPLMEQFTGGSLGRIEAEATELSNILAADRPLLASLDRVPLETKELLNNAHQKYQKGRFPLGYLPEFYGHLGDFIIYAPKWSNVGHIAGFKYIDYRNPSNGGGSQLIIVNFKQQYTPDEHYRGIKPRHKMDISHHTFFKRYGLKMDCTGFQEMEGGVKGVFKRAHITADYSTLSDLEIDLFLQSLRDLEALVKAFKEFADNTLEGKPLDSEKAKIAIIHLHSIIKKTIEALPTEYLKITAQIAVAKAMDEVKKGVNTQITDIVAAPKPSLIGKIKGKLIDKLNG